MQVESVSSNDISPETVAQEIVDRGMAAPAIFIFEMFKPMSGVFREGINLAAPLILGFVGTKLYRNAMNLLGSQGALERIICAIEEKESEKVTLKGNDCGR